MALTTDQETVLRGLFASQGVEATMEDVKELAASRDRDTAVASLSAGSRLSVTDWGPIDAALAAGIPPRSLYHILNLVLSKLEAHDTANLGPLLIALAIAEKVHRGV